MANEWDKPCILEHTAARLEPLIPDHAGELARAAETLETFRYFSRGPTDLTEPGMRGFIDYLLGLDGVMPFCVIDPTTDSRVGITTYLDIRPAHRALEIGWTWYAASCRGTRLNPACKLLLMGHAFERLGANRVCLKTDERNTRSRAAILKLGASFEGVLRENVLMPDGHRRSTAMYSVLAGEWGAVKQGLLVRLQ